MKKRVLFSLIVMLSLVSCKKEKNNIIIINEEDTIKKSITGKESEIFWTDPIDSEILLEKLTFPEVLENCSTFNVMLINSVPNTFNKVLPSIKEIGSLDNSDLSSEINIFVKRICNSIMKNPETGLTEFFDKDYLFNKTFFVNDLKEMWNGKFNQKYPEKNLFDKYYIGRINENFDLTETKVRFYKNNNYVDITLFISQNEKKLNLKQIEINNQE